MRLRRPLIGLCAGLAMLVSTGLGAHAEPWPTFPPNLRGPFADGAACVAEAKRGLEAGAWRKWSCQPSSGGAWWLTFVEVR